MEATETPNPNTAIPMDGEKDSTQKRSHEAAEANHVTSCEPDQKKVKVAENSDADVVITKVTSPVIDLTGNATDSSVVAKGDGPLVSSTDGNGASGDTAEAGSEVKPDAVGAGRLTELDVGMTEYMGSAMEPFTATIKQRYSDFVVNEIDTDGNIVRLKNVTFDEKEVEGEEEEEEKIGEKASEVLCETDREAIQKMVKEQNKDAFHNVMAPEDKAVRSKIHLAVKQSFSQLESSTGQDETGAKVIRVSWRKGKRRDAERDEWPKSKKSCRYVRFVLYKENKDTMDTIGLISKNLRLKEGMFQYAGTKDKRAKTTQEVTVHRVHPNKLVRLNKTLWDIRLGDFRFVEEPLRLGQLSGNHFTIALRNVKASQDVVDTAMTSLRDKGFINYFGMQRFGTTSIPTHQIGSTLLQGKWEDAIDLILGPRNDVPVKDVFQKKWAETKDAAATLELTPRFCGIERNLLHALVKKASPFNALDKIARNTHLLYLHSYQSYVWNKMASRRLSELGHCVVEGDLVMEASAQSAPLDDDKETVAKPVVVTKDTLASYSLTDVVLPMPGHSVLYPDNTVAEWYREALAEDGLDIDNMKRPHKVYSLPGAYRHVAIIPKGVTWSHHSYNDFTKALIQTDLDRIKQVTLPAGPDNGSMQAVVVEMSLPSSCYATMALREVMRTDTSSFFQATTNVKS